MRIATWNVNSLRSRIDRVEALLDRHEIDVLALQETKAREDQLPLMGLQAAGVRGRRGRAPTSGTASRSSAGSGSRTSRSASPGSPAAGDPVAAESRAIGATCGGVRIWSLYVPNGRKPDDPHYVYKLDWYARAARGRARAGSAATPPWSATGTSARTDDDVFDIAQFTNSTHVTPPERAAFLAFLEDGWVDMVQPHTPGRGYTYWDYYRQRFERNRGLRIDFVLGSPSLAARVTGAFIDRDERDPAQGRAPLRPRAGDRRPRELADASALEIPLSRRPGPRHRPVGGRLHAGGMEILTLFLTLLVGLALGAVVGVLWSRSRAVVQPPAWSTRPR